MHGGGHIHEPGVGQKPQKEIVQPVAQHHAETGPGQRASQNGRPEDIRCEVEHEGDNGPVKPDLFFLAGRVLAAVEQQDAQDEDTDDTRLCVEKGIVQMYRQSCLLSDG